ncbi:hypothetical protein IW140_005263 [Coemansia sp. RSA 1813]|nr:hypothetical protein EV178_004271 [Coemansia sp. RSA 1646]KAJ1770842.1 hypothetical protein LPJ74_002828 [Coemansia sp. RSA 1843]KAJ2087108.1 hypothetical protein IW138_005206 [Coemansia sp. RSA 986]KAJ2211741.1 hypothetical protein EV179_005242 [Coemansia sp. RSA 487]KAJ2565627.1 hypothetical protein IW140_005263 [Coemansia sp. RSA 1813]
MKCLLQIASVLALGIIGLAAASPTQQHAFVAPGTAPESGLYSSDRLIKLSETAQPQLMAMDDIFGLRRAGVRFIDITDAQELYQDSAASAAKNAPLPTSLTRGDDVRQTIDRLSTKLYGDVLTPFTAFHNRYYDSQNGKKSSEWLQQQIAQLVDDSSSFAATNVTVRAFGHKFPQSSIILRIEGSDPQHAQETVLLSAHQDSVNMWLPWFGRASGADDDGSGTVTILESLRALLAQGFAPTRSVEFHWYAGEEGGLLGSQDVALDYKRAGRSVVANLHFDMTGFWKKGSKEVIGLVSDRTDPEVRALVKSLAETYTRLKTSEFACGYGCSDHASWNQAGYRSAMAFESDELEANTFIHTPSDTVDTLDFDHMLEFSKLAVAFAYEVGYAK